MRKEIAILIGIPGSGKSTYVNRTLLHQGYQLICRDDLRRIFPDHKRHGPYVSAIANSMCAAFMERGLSIVVDETNTKLFQINKWLDIAKEYEYTTVGVLIDTDIKLCIERRINTNFPIDVIENMNISLNKLRTEIDLESLFDKFYIIEGKGLK